MSTNSRRHSIIRSLDWTTIGLVVAIAIFGWFNIYGACFDFEQTSIFDFSNFAGKQLVWLAGATLLASGICIASDRIYGVLAYVLYGLVLALLLVTPLVATNIKGSYSWISLGPVSLQPAEFAKPFVALAVAKFMSQYGYRLRDWRDLLVPGALIAAPMFIIMVLQQETGSALVFAGFLLVFYREGMSPLVLLTLAVVAVVAVLSLRFSWWVGVIAALLAIAGYLIYYRKRLFHVGSLQRNWKEWLLILLFVVMNVAVSVGASVAFNKVLKPHQRTRIEVLLGMRDDPTGAGYNVTQSRIAIGSGQIFGKGYLQGTQTKLHYVPEQHTDFIFCTVGEEWGFVGSTVLLLVYLAFLLRLAVIAERQRETFSRIYGYAVFSIFLVHLTINIGMILGLLPVIGIPLPFFSYGGSSLWSFTMLLFILLRLDAARTERLH